MADLDPNKPRKIVKKDKDMSSDRQHEFFLAIHSFIGSFVKDRLDSGKRKKEKGLIEHFILKIKSIFRPSVEIEKKQERKLVGRIRELNKNAGEVLDVLNSVRADLKSEVDGELFGFVESVMNPMIRDISRIQKVVLKEGLVHPQVDALNQYNEWIDRAKLWVQVCSSAKNKEAITEAILKHTLEDFNAIINKDLQLIEDYQDHLLDELEMDHADKVILRKEIKNSLGPYLRGLLDLKVTPEDLNFQNLNEWKLDADKRRDHYYNMILHVIDSKTEGLTTIKKEREDREYLSEVFEKLSYLETEIPLLFEKINIGTTDPFEIEATIQQLYGLQEEVDLLYHDIRMPHQIIDRLQKLKEILKKSISKLR